MIKKYQQAKIHAEHILSLFTQADKAWQKNRNGSNASRFWIQRQKYQRQLIQAKREEQQAFEAMLKEQSIQAKA